MRRGTFYLNNSGSRWVTLPKEVLTFKTKSGKEIKRKPIYFESWGNFATALISYKGKRISVFADTVLED